LNATRENKKNNGLMRNESATAEPPRDQSCRQHAN
jgi:hypothetical protein